MMSDSADHANEAQSLYTQMLCENRVQYQGISATECEECGNPIPKERRRVIPGVKLCVACQEVRER